MLQQLFHIVILSTVCIIWGIPVLLILVPVVKKEQFWYHSAAGLLGFLFFCGCLFISALSSWLYLVSSLNFFYLALCTLAIFIYLFLFQRIKIIKVFLEILQNKGRVSFVSILFICISILLFVLLGSLQPVNGDTQIYHMQIIRWQSEYRVVPGIANLYPRLGLGSAWFNLITIFYIPVFRNENFTYLNASFVIWFFIWLFSKWHFYFQNQGENSNTRLLSIFYFLLLLYCMFDWQLYRDSANSTNYDFAINAFTIIICSFFIEGIFINKPRDEFSVVVLFFCLCEVSFKLSGIFILLLVLYHFFISRKTVKWVAVLLASTIILLPVFIKNYIATGYPLFPATFTFNAPDWMLPRPLAKGFFRYIILSNRFYNHQWSFANKFDLGTLHWIPYWFNGILWKHKIVLALSLSSVFYLFRKTSLTINHKQLRMIIIILLLMLTGWFFTAPDPGRFGYGILLSISFLVISLFLHAFPTAKFYSAALLVATVTVAGYTIKKSKPIIHNLSYTIFPVSFPEPPYQIIRADSIDLNLPYKINDNWDCRCYFTELPCITQKNPFLHTRGKDLKQGFRMYPQPDSSFISNYIY